MSKICLECHYENSNAADFCERCGKKIVNSISEAASLKCGNCGARLDLNSNFCPKCGMQVNQSSQLSSHDKTERMLDAHYNSMEKNNNSLMWIFIIIAGIISFIMILSYFGEFGFGVLIIPIVFAIIGIILYFEFKVKNKIFHYGGKAITDVIRKDK